MGLNGGIMNSECKGCRIYKKCNLSEISNVSGRMRCPCLTCLVKGICNEVCKEYSEYSKAVYRYYNKIPIRVRIVTEGQRRVLMRFKKVKVDNKGFVRLDDQV